MTGVAYAPSNSLIWSADAINKEGAMGLFGKKKIRLGESTSLNIGKQGISSPKRKPLPYIPTCGTTNFTSPTR